MLTHTSKFIKSSTVTTTIVDNSYLRNIQYELGNSSKTITIKLKSNLWRTHKQRVKYSRSWEFRMMNEHNFEHHSWKQWPFNPKKHIQSSLFTFT